MANGEFQTGDLLMAAFLQTRGHELVGLRPGGNGKFDFVFADSAAVQRDAKEFLEDGLIPVRSLARRIAKLKSRCREGRQRGPMEFTNDEQPPKR